MSIEHAKIALQKASRSRYTRSEIVALYVVALVVGGLVAAFTPVFNLWHELGHFLAATVSGMPARLTWSAVHTSGYTVFVGMAGPVFEWGLYFTVALWATIKGRLAVGAFFGGALHALLWLAPFSGDMENLRIGLNSSVAPAIGGAIAFGIVVISALIFWAVFVHVAKRHLPNT